MEYIEWIVWTILTIVTVVMFIVWSVKKDEYQHGQFYDTPEVITLIAIPRIAFAEAIPLVAFLFIDLNKLHLLWIYPAVYFIINYLMAKKVDKADKERLKKN